MIIFALGVEDLADTRFAISPINETVLSLRVLREPGLYALHLPWRRSVLGRLDPPGADLLMSLVGPHRAVPDFLTPRPAKFAATFEEELAAVRGTPPDVVRRDVAAVYVRGRLPDILQEIDAADDAPVVRLRDTICYQLQRYWEVAAGTTIVGIPLPRSSDAVGTNTNTDRRRDCSHVAPRRAQSATAPPPCRAAADGRDRSPAHRDTQRRVTTPTGSPRDRHDHSCPRRAACAVSAQPSWRSVGRSVGRAVT